MLRESPAQVLTGVVIGFAVGFGVQYLFHQHTKSQLESVKMQLESSRQDIQEQRYRIANLTDINDSGSREREQLQEEIRTLSAMNEDLLNDNELYLTKNQFLELDVAALREEIDALVDQLNRYAGTLFPIPGEDGASADAEGSGSLGTGGFVTNPADGLVTNPADISPVLDDTPDAGTPPRRGVPGQGGG